MSKIESVSNVLINKKEKKDHKKEDPNLVCVKVSSFFAFSKNTQKEKKDFEELPLRRRKFYCSRRERASCFWDDDDDDVDTQQEQHRAAAKSRRRRRRRRRFGGSLRAWRARAVDDRVRF